MQLSANFRLEEFACKDGTPVPFVFLENVQDLACNLQALRDVLQAPIRINSAYRHEDYNRSVGGRENSRHLTAEAADISVVGYAPIEVYETISRLINEGSMDEGGLGLYETFVHYDIRGKKARW